MGAVVPDSQYLVDRRVKEVVGLVPSANNQDVIDALVLSPSGPNCFSPMDRLLARLKAAALLLCIYAVMLPLSLLGMLLAAASHCVHSLLSSKVPGTTNGLLPSQAHALPLHGTAMVSGGNKTKALHVCRHLSRAGWQVVLVDGHKNWACCTRFSSCVSAFHTVPVPTEDPAGYLKAISSIAEQEDVKLWVPVSIAQYSVHEALAAELMPKGCLSCTVDAATVAVLNDKIKFSKLCEETGLLVPKAFAITSAEQLIDCNSRPEMFEGKRFLLKSIAYAAVNRADLFTLPCDPQVLARYIEHLEISAEKPWQLQQFMQGPEYASYSIASKGTVVAHVDNAAELSCLNYAHVGLPQIRQWVETFCARTGISGQICFDFILNREDQKLYAIECNPRTSTNLVAFHNHPGFAKAYFAPESGAAASKVPITPLASACPVYWVWNEVGSILLNQKFWRALPHTKQLEEMWQTLSAGVDAVFDVRDPLPFLALHYLQVPLQLLSIVKSGVPWTKVDLCSGKVVQVNGD